MKVEYKERVLKLADEIAKVTQGHERLEIIDAMDIAKIFCRLTPRGHDQETHASLPVPEEFSSATR